jgi:hypothetical protein
MRYLSRHSLQATADAPPGRHSWPTIGGQAKAGALCIKFVYILPSHLYCLGHTPVSTFFDALQGLKDQYYGGQVFIKFT